MVKQKTIYVVATPIGNLEDITARAIETLKTVDFIAAEDTRHSQRLLTHYGIHTPLVSLHEHNEYNKAKELLERVSQGNSMALISDAGTPLISDPGYSLVHQALEQGIKVVPVPGVSALITALSVSGLPTDRFIFEGFLPAKATARRLHLEALLRETRTLLFYEAPHRLIDTLQDMHNIFGKEREAVIARELTKHFETIRRDSLQALLGWVQRDANQQRGEIVILVRGFLKKDKEGETASGVLEQEVERILKILVAELPVKQASMLAHQITGVQKRQLYEAALKFKNG